MNINSYLCNTQNSKMRNAESNKIGWVPIAGYSTGCLTGIGKAEEIGQ